MSISWWERQRDQHQGFFRIAPHAYRLLADGAPVPLDRLASVASLPVRDVEAALKEQPGTDWDERGRLVGLGLTLRPTPHRFTFEDGRTAFTWCASDALVIPVVVGRSGTLESTCPATGRPVRVEMTPERVMAVSPPGAVVSLVRPDRIGDIRGEICDLGHFFVSWEAAADWLAGHLDGTVHTVEEDFRLHREIMEKVGWAIDSRTC